MVVNKSEEFIHTSVRRGRAKDGKHHINQRESNNQSCYKLWLIETMYALKYILIM